MPFLPKFDAQFLEPIIENIIALLTVQERAALEWANGGPVPDADSPMSPTLVWRRSMWFSTLLPMTSVVAISTQTAQADDDSRIEQVHLIDVEIEIDGNDPDVLAISAMRRVRALDMILRGAKFGDICEGMRAGGFSLEIGEHGYTQFKQRDMSIYKIVAGFSVTVTVVEGRHV